MAVAVKRVTAFRAFRDANLFRFGSRKRLQAILIKAEHSPGAHFTAELSTGRYLSINTTTLDGR